MEGTPAGAGGGGAGAGGQHAAPRVGRGRIAALGEGRIGFDHARVLADAANPRVADAIAQVQDDLVRSAEGSPFGAWQRGVAELVELADQDGGHDPADDVVPEPAARRRVGDTVEIRGQLVGDAALSFTEALEQATDALWHRYKTDHDACPELAIPARSTLRALALVELCRHGLTRPDPAPAVDITLVINARTARSAPPTATGSTHAPAAICGATRSCTPCIIRPSQPLDLKRSVRFATPPPTPGPGHPRPRLSLPRLRRPTVVVRRPPHHLLGTRRRHRHRQPRPVVPPPPRRHPPQRLDPHPPPQRRPHLDHRRLAAPSPAENPARPRCCRSAATWRTTRRARARSVRRSTSSRPCRRGR